MSLKMRWIFSVGKIVKLLNVVIYNNKVRNNYNRKYHNHQTLKYYLMIIYYVEQQLLTLPEHLSSPTVLSGIRDAQPLVVCVVFWRLLFICIFVSFDHCIACLSVFSLLLLISSNFSQKCLKDFHCRWQEKSEIRYIRTFEQDVQITYKTVLLNIQMLLNVLIFCFKYVPVI